MIEGNIFIHSLYVKWTNFCNTYQNFAKLSGYSHDMCKISWKLVENWLRNRRNSFTTFNVNPTIVTWWIRGYKIICGRHNLHSALQNRKAASAYLSDHHNIADRQIHIAYSKLDHNPLWNRQHLHVSVVYPLFYLFCHNRFFQLIH